MKKEDVTRLLKLLFESEPNDDEIRDQAKAMGLQLGDYANESGQPFRELVGQLATLEALETPDKFTKEQHWRLATSGSIVGGTQPDLNKAQLLEHIKQGADQARSFLELVRASSAEAAAEVERAAAAPAPSPASSAAVPAAAGGAPAVEATETYDGGGATVAQAPLEGKDGEHRARTYTHKPPPPPTPGSVVAKPAPAEKRYIATAEGMPTQFAIPAEAKRPSFGGKLPPGAASSVQAQRTSHAGDPKGKATVAVKNAEIAVVDVQRWALTLPEDSPARGAAMTRGTAIRKALAEIAQILKET